MKMTLRADLTADHTFEWALFGAPPKTAIEFRIQNTMNGQMNVLVIDTDSCGKAPVPCNVYGRHITVTARVLNDKEQACIYTFSFDNEIIANHLSLTAQRNHAVAKRSERLANV